MAKPDERFDMVNPTRGITSVRFTPSELERFWSKVDQSGRCWRWLATLNPSGYGTFGFRRTSTSAHRASYLVAHGEIPAGMVIDHLCRNRACVNPDHLEPVTPRINSLRSPLVVSTHCPNGHEYTPESTVSYKTNVGTRQKFCRECRNTQSRENMRRYRAERKLRAR